MEGQNVQTSSGQNEVLNSNITGSQQNGAPSAYVLNGQVNTAYNVVESHCWNMAESVSRQNPRGE